MSASDIKLLAALDRAIETLTDRRENAARRLAAIANEFRRATYPPTGNVWIRHLTHGYTMTVHPIVSTDGIERVSVRSRITTRDGSDESIADTMPLAYLEGDMSLDDAIAPVLAAQQRERDRQNAELRTAELQTLALLQAKYHPEGTNP